MLTRMLILEDELSTQLVCPFLAVSLCFHHDYMEIKWSIYIDVSTKWIRTDYCLRVSIYYLQKVREIQRVILQFYKIKSNSNLNRKNKVVIQCVWKHNVDNYVDFEGGKHQQGIKQHTNVIYGSIVHAHLVDAAKRFQ